MQCVVIEKIHTPPTKGFLKSSHLIESCIKRARKIFEFQIALRASNFPILRFFVAGKGFRFWSRNIQFLFEYKFYSCQ